MKKIVLPNVTEYIDRFFDFVNEKVGQKVVNAFETFGKCGLRALDVLAVLSVVAAIVFMIRFETGVVFAMVFAVVGVLGCVLLQYAATKMLPALNTLVKNAPTKLSSAVFLKVLALFVGVGGLIALAVGVLIWTGYDYVDPTTANANAVALGCVGAFVACEFWMFLFLKPEELNVEVVEKTSVGEEFIGLTSYFAKGCLKLTPVVFGLTVLLAVVWLVVMMFSPIEAVVMQLFVLVYLGVMALLPFFMYAAFLSYYLTLDILTAVLSLPAKLDKIKE